MTRIAHLSDLHFGYHRTELVDALLDRVNRAQADLVVVSGDVTHRGRRAQYAQAAAFLARVNAPVMVVPGNHDVPLYNLAHRFLAPYWGYRRFIDPDLTPVRQAGAVRVMGMNSADPFAVQRGRMREQAVDRLTASLDPIGTNIVALHHPLEHLPQVDKELPRFAPQALAHLEKAGVQIILSGHLHVWATGAMLDHTLHPGVLQVQAGTALCARETDRQNEFSVLQVNGPRLRIERHVAPMSRPAFDAPIYEYFSRESGVWLAHQPAEEPIVPGAGDATLVSA